MQQVTIRSLKKAAGDTPALLLSHVGVVLDNDYNVKTLKSSNNLRWFALLPKKSDNMFAVIQMGFTNNEIREMRLQDHLGHTTAIKFFNSKMNVVLSSSLFIFTPPANVDVIDETRRR